MKKSFTINGHEVEFTACTAIAASIGDTARQDAVFVHDVEDECGNGDCVVFAASLPESEEEAAALCEEYGDTDVETLDTVVFSDGSALADYFESRL